MSSLVQLRLKVSHVSCDKHSSECKIASNRQILYIFRKLNIIKSWFNMKVEKCIIINTPLQKSQTSC